MKRNIYGLIISVLAVSVGLTSCLKDDMVDSQKYGLINLNANKIIEIPSTASHTQSIISLDEGVKEYVREIRLASENPATEDVVVNLEVINDASTVIGAVRKRLADQYPTTGDNAVDDADILIYPTTGITIPASVTIPKGQRSVELKIQVDTHILTGAAQFVMVGVKSVDKPGYIVSGNFGNLLLNMKVMSIYDGMYRTKGYFKHPTLGKSEFDWSGADGEPLSTVNGSTVEMPWAGDRAIAVRMEVTSATMTVDGKTVNKVNITIPSYPGAFGQESTDDTGATMNYYDPSTKTFELFYWYNNSAHRIIRETLIYEGERK